MVFVGQGLIMEGTMQQWTWALISSSVLDFLLANMTQQGDEGDNVTVWTNEGQQVTVRRNYGGYSAAIRPPGWVGLIGTTQGAALDQFAAALGPAAIELCRLGAKQAELDEAMPEQKLTILNGWLASVGGVSVDGGTNRECIEAAFGQFQPGFQCSQYYVG
jgi:hypothetical protein